MSKVKMRCINCGKRFQSANAKEALCPECSQKSRKEKLAARSGPVRPAPGPQRPGMGGGAGSVPPPRPRSASGGTSHWLDSLPDVRVGEPEQALRPRPPAGPRGDHRAGHESHQDRSERHERGERHERSERHERPAPRGPAQYWEAERRSPLFRSGPSSSGQPGRLPLESGPGRRPRPGPGGPGPAKIAAARNTRAAPAAPKQSREPVKASRQPPQPKPKPKREKTPPPAPFVPTAEQVALVEARYKELARPVEFDGIRTRIAHELNIPKSAVKRIVKALREREGLPSWWEVQPYRGNSEELAKIRALYEPLLPVPPIGIHRTIAQQLALKPAMVYQAIRLIRQELKLPQYNDPRVHARALTSGPEHGQNQEMVPALPTSATVFSPAQEASFQAERTEPPPAAESGGPVATPESDRPTDG
jgi:predicted  nucleic acid-binding Zn-ribbon protein